jgi:putative Holliday junction resolvase
MAFPRDVVLAGKTAVEEIVGIAVAEEVTTVVVGRPLSLSGATGASAEIADVFTHELRTALLPHDISVQTLDERFTTSTAAQHLRASGTSSKAARQRIDSAAATVLLETYLEHLRGVD